MGVFHFKLLGGFGDERSENDIQIPFEATVEQVKEKIRTAFKIAPGLIIELMFQGKNLQNHEKWGMLSVRPLKDTILVIGHRND
jgi:hypothetical protein